MIFVCVGSREYPFDRLFLELDKLVESGELHEEIFAQIGQSKYIPKQYQYERFLSADEFKQWQEKADIIISHAGVGSLIGALKNRKKVIAVPRLAKYGEALDDHQMQIASIFEQEKYLYCVYDMQSLGKTLKKATQNHNEIKPYDRPSYIVDIIRDYIK